MTIFGRMTRKSSLPARQKGSGTLGLLLIVALIAAWLTHIVVGIKTASWGALIAGALLFPVGIIHGVLIWFGVA